MNARMSSLAISEINRFKKSVFCYEIIVHRRYTVPTTAGSRRLLLEVHFSPTFPQDPPQIFLQSSVKHPWMADSEYGQFVHAPGILFWGVESRDVVEVLEQIICELKKMLMPEISIKQAYKTSDLNFIQINSTTCPEFNKFTVWELHAYSKGAKKMTKRDVARVESIFQDYKRMLRDLIDIGWASEEDAAAVHEDLQNRVQYLKQEYRNRCKSKSYAKLLKLYDNRKLQMCFYRIANKCKAAIPVAKKFLAGDMPVELFLNTFSQEIDK